MWGDLPRNNTEYGVLCPPNYLAGFVESHHHLETLELRGPSVQCFFTKSNGYANMRDLTSDAPTAPIRERKRSLVVVFSTIRLITTKCRAWLLRFTGGI